MPNYEKSKIYAIRSHKTDEVYIGSTTQPLSKRMSDHRSKYKLYTNGKHHYVTSFKIVEHGDAYIELVENVQCLCKEGLLKRDGEFMRATENCVNKNIAGRNVKEWRKDNKERISGVRKQYREQHKEKIVLQKKQYYKNNKEKIAIRNRLYRSNNKEAMAVRHKNYNEANKEQIKAYKAQVVLCVCGETSTKNNILQHMKTKHHRILMSL